MGVSDCFGCDLVLDFVIVSSCCLEIVFTRFLVVKLGCEAVVSYAIQVALIYLCVNLSLVFYFGFGLGAIVCLDSLFYWHCMFYGLLIVAWWCCFKRLFVLCLGDAVFVGLVIVTYFGLVWLVVYWLIVLVVW